MKIRLFYSWQSDLPNSTNRGFIEKCLNSALKEIYESNKHISEFSILSDSRDETGTPDIVASIFAKIDLCDIVVSDISIINPQSKIRKTPNPNVLVELGYASGIIGWDRVICLFNDEYGAKEDLPFDIRSRKPIGYSPSKDKSKARALLTRMLRKSIQDIIDSRLTDKKYVASTKQVVDLGLQAVLFDVLRLLFFFSSDNSERFNYPMLLHISIEQLTKLLMEVQFFGFQLLKNHDVRMTEFRELYNDSSSMFFFSEREKTALAKLIVSMDKYKRFCESPNAFDDLGASVEFEVVSAASMNPENPANSYILLKKLEDGNRIVQDSGEFRSLHIKNLQNRYRTKPRYAHSFASMIRDMAQDVQEWINATGGVFIYNQRMIRD